MRRIWLGWALLMVWLMTGCQVNSLEEPETPEGRWLLDRLRVLDTLDPLRGYDEDLADLIQYVGEARVVGIGEATHGTSEFRRLWHRLFRALAEKSGHRLLIMEKDFIPFYRMNRYVVDNEGMAQSVYYGWWTTEARDLLEWMHDANRNRSPGQKLWILGCDILNYRKHIDYVLEMVQPVDSPLAGEFESLTAGLYSYSSGFTYRDTASSAEKNAIRADLSRARHRIREKESLLISRYGEWESSFILKAVEVILQSEDFYRDEAGAAERDRYMFENIRWLVSRFDHAKAVTTSHNEHLALRLRDRKHDVEWDSTGWYLRRHYGSAYVSIAQTFYEGSFAVYWGTGTVGSAIAESYEHYFDQARRSLFYLDLRSLDATHPDGQWITGPRWFRLIDESFTAGDTAEETFTRRPLVRDFDLVVYIRDSSPLHRL